MKLDEIGYNYKTGVLVSVVSTAASLQHTQGQSSHVSVWRIYVFFSVHLGFLRPCQV